MRLAALTACAVMVACGCASAPPSSAESGPNAAPLESKEPLTGDEPGFRPGVPEPEPRGGPVDIEVTLDEADDARVRELLGAPAADVERTLRERVGGCTGMQLEARADTVALELPVPCDTSTGSLSGGLVLRRSSGGAVALELDRVRAEAWRAHGTIALTRTGERSYRLHSDELALQHRSGASGGSARGNRITTYDLVSPVIRVLGGLVLPFVR